MLVARDIRGTRLRTSSAPSSCVVHNVWKCTIIRFARRQVVTLSHQHHRSQDGLQYGIACRRCFESSKSHTLKGDVYTEFRRYFPSFLPSSFLLLLLLLLITPAEEHRRRVEFRSQSGLLITSQIQGRRDVVSRALKSGPLRTSPLPSDVPHSNKTAAPSAVHVKRQLPKISRLTDYLFMSSSTGCVCVAG